MEEKVKKKLDRARKWNKLQVVAAVCMFAMACVNIYLGRIDVAFLQLIIGAYCLLLYQTNVREDTLVRGYLECLDNNDYLFDFGLLEKAKADFYQGKITKDELAKIAFEFNLKHKVWNEEELRNDADTSADDGVQK